MSDFPNKMLKIRSSSSNLVNCHEDRVVPYYTLLRNYKFCVNITKNRLSPLYVRKPDFPHFDGKLLETYSMCLCVFKTR